MSNQSPSTYYFPSFNTINSKWKDKCLDLLKNVENERKNCNIGPEDNTKNLIKNKEELAANFKKVQKEVSDLQKQLEDLELAIKEKPTIREELLLYQTITKIQWDLNSPENHIKGFVANPFTTFDLDTTKLSKQEIVDHFWKLLDPGS